VGSRNLKTKTRPAAIEINIKNYYNFLTLAKRIKRDFNNNVVSNNITSMRKANNKGLLLEINGDQGAVDTMITDVTSAACRVINVRLLQQRALEELRDI